MKFVNFLVVVSVSFFLKWLFNPFPNMFDSISDRTEGKKIIITGASQGIGKNISIKLASYPLSQITIVARSLSKLEEIKRQIDALASNVVIHVMAVDLSSEEDCRNMVAKGSANMGGLDMIILNHITSARFGFWLNETSTTTYTDTSYISEIFTVNTFSYFWLASAAIESLQASRGQIVVVSSLAGHVGTPLTAAYSASKHALHGFFNALR